MTDQQKKKLAVLVATLLGGSGVVSIVAALPEPWHRPAMVILPFVGMVAGIFLPAVKGEAPAEKVVLDPPVAVAIPDPVPVAPKEKP